MSITLAAKDLCLTQSALSRQIQSLAEHLGTPLLIRKHRAIALTAEGEQLLQLASPWLDRLSEYCASLQQGGRLRPVTITASISVTSLWILPRLGAFQAVHPNIDVRISANTRVLNLKQERIDLAIRYAREDDIPPGAVRLFGERCFRSPARKWPPAPSELPMRCWTKSCSSSTRVLALGCDGPIGSAPTGMPDAKPKAYLHLNQYDQLIQAAIEGHGLALGRVALLLPMLKDGRLVALAENGFGNSNYAYWLIVESPAPRGEVQEFRNWLIKEVQLGVAELEGMEIDAHPPSAKD